MNRRVAFRFLAALALALVGGAVTVHAQTYVPIRITADAYLDDPGEGNTGDISLSATLAPSSPTANDAYQYNLDDGTAYESVSALIWWKPVQVGRSYEISVNGSYLAGSAYLHVDAPQGYQVVLNNKPRPAMEVSSVPSIVVLQLVPKKQDPHLAGYASSISINRIDWRLPLGSLLDGQSAGSIGLIDPGTDSAWASLYTPARLYYESTADEVWTYRDNNVLRQVVAPQVAVDVVTIDATSYEIRCYHPSQIVSPTATPRTFTGQPYACYRIASMTPQFGGTSPVAIKFTKEVRNVSSGNLSPAVTRREFMTLERNGTWPAFHWVKRDWYAEGETPVSETVTDSSVSGSIRSEAITVRTPNTTTPVLQLSRTYTQLSGICEMLASETVGSTNPGTATFNYYPATTQYVLPGGLRSVQLASGQWLAFDYRSGMQIERTYEPYVNSPSTITQDVAQGKLTTYSYGPDLYGGQGRMNGATTKINGVIVSSIAHDYTDYQSGSYNGYTVDSQQKRDFSNYTTSLIKSLREDYPASVYRGKPVSICNPDRSKTGYLYERGHWDGTSWSASTTPDGFRETVVTGVEVPATGLPAATPIFRAMTPEVVVLVKDKSTMKVRIWDRGLLVREESRLCDVADAAHWDGGGWQTVAWTTYTYNFLGLLTDRVASNGATYHAVYDGFLKSSETDEAGVTTTYTYDAAGRTFTATRSGSGAISSTTTEYAYDAMGSPLSEATGPVSGEQLVTSRTYDTAGRLATETPLGGFGVITHAYDPAARTHTVSRSGGGTRTETSYLDGRLYSVTGTGVVPEYHTYGAATDRTLWERTDVGSATSSRWSKSFTHFLGAVTRTEQPGFNGAADVVAEKFFNLTPDQTSTGHIVRGTQPGPTGTAITNRYEYNVLGEAYRSGLDPDNNGLVLASSDRITEASEYLELYSGSYWWRKDAIVYAQAATATPTLVGFTRARLTGFTGTLVAESQSQDADGNVTTVKTELNRTTQTKTVTTTTTGISNAKVETYVAGLLVSVVSPDGVTVSTGYDSLLRPSVVTDSRGTSSTTTYVTGTKLPQTVVQKLTATTNAVTTFHYDTAGRKDWLENPDAKRTFFAYNRRDQLLRQWGAATYPVEYAYNTLGEKIAMRTFRSPSQDFTTATWPLTDGGSDSLNPDPAQWTSGDKTTWTYDAATGLLTGKTDASNHSVNYTYNAALKLATRDWARTVSSGPNIGQRVRTTYGYSATTGEQNGITYNDGTPALSYYYTRLGQVDSVTDAATGVHDFVYDPTYAHRLSCEAFDTFYGQRVLTRLYESSGVVGRARGFQLGAVVGSNSELEQSYGFAPDTSRLASISSTSTPLSSTARVFRYGYEPDSSLVKTLWTDDTSFYVTRSFETYRDVLETIDTKWDQSATSSISKYAYHSNALVQRDSVVQTGDAFSAYSGTDHAIHQTFAYNAKGEVTGAPTFAGATTTDTSTPLANRQHEFNYDSIGNRSWVGVTGNALDRKTYTPNALNQLESRSESAAPFSGTQSFGYDADGNVTDDGLWTYAWDAENRLVSMIATTAAVNAGKPNLWIAFAYDYLGRRVEKKVTDLAANGGVIDWRRYVYDGWSIVAEYNVVSSPSSLVLFRSYTWGLDIARSLTDDGGVGALLQIADHASGKRFFPTYDGNGNIAALVNASSGAIAATYEYSPFGETIRADVVDSAIANQPFRFSTKYYDAETALYDYGHRYYNPDQARFINRDPTGEVGGNNLYGFCANDGINNWDVLGDGPYITTISGVQYQIDMVPRNVFNPGSVPAGSWTATPDTKWGISATLVWSFNGGLSLGLSPTQFIYVRTPVKTSTSGPTITVTIPPTNTTPATPTSTTPAPKTNLIDNYTASAITPDVVATLLINEVAFPGSPGFKSWDDTKRAMDAIAAELYNRLHAIPNGWTQKQIAGIDAVNYQDLILKSGQYQDFNGTEAQRVVDHINYLVGIANQGGPGPYADAINHAIILSRLLRGGGTPIDPFANQGGTYGHMQSGNSPGGAFKNVGTSGGNDFFTVPPKPPRKPSADFIGPGASGYMFPDLPVAPDLIFASNP